MNHFSRALERLATAPDAADVLDTACEVFEGILAMLRRHRDDEKSAFPAFVLAASAAANGRDWTGGEWASHWDGAHQDADAQLTKGAAVAAEIAAASGELAVLLFACASAATDEAEREACAHAAEEAATIRDLLGGASPP